MFQSLSSLILLAVGISGLAAVGIAAYWVFNRESKKRHLEELRQTYQNMSPTDPQYNTARALFVAASISDAAANQYLNAEGSSSSGGDGGAGTGDP